MSDQYVGEIRMFSGNYAPQGWHFCDGTKLDINEYQVLFTLIGTTYGGDGVSNFQLPDLRGRVAIHTSTGYPLGQTGGTEEVTLSREELPKHTHPANANNTAADATSTSPENNLWGYNTVISNYQSVAANVQMSPSAISEAGGSRSHNNTMPSAATSFIIALQGIYPSQG